MTLKWMAELPQTTILDEADQLATRHLQGPFHDVRAIYATVGFDVVEFAQDLQTVTAAARTSRGEALAAQGRYEVESAQSRAAVDEVSRWIEQLHLAARYAKVSGHALGADVERLFGIGHMSADSWSAGIDALHHAIAALSTSDDLTDHGLPADFAARGLALVDRLRKERSDQGLAATERAMHTARLHALLDEIVASFERISAARDFAMAMTGKEIPGLELTYARSAAAPRPAATTPDDPGL